jgi:hypothetical protein
MKIIALLNFAEGQTPDALAPLAVAEAEAVWKQVKTGLIRGVYYRTEQPGAVLEIEASDITVARAVVEALPAVQAGIVELDQLLLLAPYTGFEALFS